MAKWFSFNQQTQRTEEIVPTEEAFQSSSLLFWSRGMSQWELGPKALEFLLNPPIHVVQSQVVTPVVVEGKKQTIGPFYKKETANTVMVEKKTDPVFEPVVITKKDKPVLKKPKNKAVKKQALQKKNKRKKSKKINLVIKKKKIKSKNKAVKLKKKKNRRKRKN